jgi:hypothetical protein
MFYCINVINIQVVSMMEAAVLRKVRHVKALIIKGNLHVKMKGME